MAQKSGKGSINKKYALVTKLYQPYIIMEINQVDIEDIIFNIDKKALILGDGFWIELNKEAYLFCGYTALCMYMHLKYVGLDEIVEQIYGKKELADDEQQELRTIKFC